MTHSIFENKTLNAETRAKYERDLELLKTGHRFWVSPVEQPLRRLADAAIARRTPGAWNRGLRHGITQSLLPAEAPASEISPFQHGSTACACNRSSSAGPAILLLG